MVLLYTSQDFELHDTGQHPEHILRIRSLNALLEADSHLLQCGWPTWQPANRDQVLTVHTESYYEQLQGWCSADAGWIESDTVVCPGSWPAATSAAGAAIDAVQRVIRGEDRRAFCAIRPPGHHALPDAPMGFCLLNNVAVAARAALSLGLDRVLIVDWDVHHGNGTQEAFYADEQVGFFSIHRSPFYPGTGAANETGAGAGLGTTLNVPVKHDITIEQFMSRFRSAVELLADRIKPQLLLVSAGFDAHRLDPVGGLCLESHDFGNLTQCVCEIANVHCSGRIVSVLEGGYHLEYMPQSAAQHVLGLLS